MGSLQTLLAGLPRAASSHFERLLDETPRTFAELRAELDDHVVQIQSASGANEFLDAALALAIASSCRALLEHTETGSGHERALAQAAVRYFVLDDDADHDLESVCGLDDDAMVCNAVARELGREDLVIPV